MKYPAILSTCFILLACNHKMDIQDIHYISESNTSESNCALSNDIGEVQITNNQDSFICVIVQPFSDENCQFYEVIKYFESKKDSLFLVGFQIGEPYRDYQLDTLEKDESKMYIFDNTNFKNSFKERIEISHIQIHYPYSETHQGNNNFFKLLLTYDSEKDVLKQMNFTVPDEVEKYRIPK